MSSFFVSLFNSGLGLLLLLGALTCQFFLFLAMAFARKVLSFFRSVAESLLILGSLGMITIYKG